MINIGIVTPVIENGIIIHKELNMVEKDTVSKSEIPKHYTGE